MISIVIRVLNEGRHLGSLLDAIRHQNTDGTPYEVVIVDSGSTDDSLDIARRHQCRIVTIRKEDFSFGRSLNIGCEAAVGEYLVFISGHCVPANQDWLSELVAPLHSNSAAYSYGRQIGNETTKFSEHQLLLKYFPADPQYAQKGFFCNNANAAILKSVWRDHLFDESLTGLEDMELAKRIASNGHKITYAPDSIVYHIHDETWRQVKRRYEREALALQHIMPEVHVHFSDFLRYTFGAVFHDIAAAWKEGSVTKHAWDIVRFRLMQYYGTYCGNQIHRELSKTMKERYFYPNNERALKKNLEFHDKYLSGYEKISQNSSSLTTKSSQL